MTRRLLLAALAGALLTGALLVYNGDPNHVTAERVVRDAGAHTQGITP